MLLKKIGTTGLGKGGDEGSAQKREDETTSLDALRNSLGPTNLLSRGKLLQDRYEVEQPIGYGGMSTVYRARDLRFKDVVRVVAIKEIFDISTDPAARIDKFQRFESEANLLASLKHPAIPTIYDFFSTNDRVYLVMELIDGRNLEAILEDAGRALDEKQVLRWAMELCDVLTYLHTHEPNPIVFRDVKPSNAMFTASGTLKVVDFGIAKKFRADDQKGTMIGTEGYSPPEQYKGQSSPTGDIYALGATMHQLLTNSDPRMQTPFTFHERMPRKLNPFLSEETERIIMRALEYEAQRRWATMAEMKAAIQHALRMLGENIPSAAPESNGRSATLDLPRPALRSPSSVLRDPLPRPGVMNGTRTSTGTRVSQRPATEILDADGMPILNPAHDAKLLWSWAAEDIIAAAPTVHRGMVYVASYDSNVYALDARNGSFLWKAATEAGIASSPTAVDDLLYVGSEDHNMYALDVRRGHQVWSYRTGGRILATARHASGMIYVGSEEGMFFALEAKGGRKAWQQRTWGPIISSAAIQPAQSQVFVGCNDGNIYCFDMSSGQMKWKQRTMQAITSSPAINEGLLYVGSQDNTVYALDTQQSWFAWKFRTNGQVRSSPAVHSGKVYVGSVDGYVYCIEAKNGRQPPVWKFRTGGQVTSSPRVVNGIVYVGSVDGNIYAIDAETGKLQWFFPTDAPVVSSAAVADGVVYIGSNDNRLYALQA